MADRSVGPTTMEIRRLISKQDFFDGEELLKTRSLKVPLCSKRWGAFDNGVLVGTLGSCSHTLMGLAVSESYENSGIATRLIGKAVTDLIGENVPNIYLFTKASESQKISDIGFHLVESTEKVVFFEWFKRFPKRLSELKKISSGLPKNAATIVMNANPFSLGHRYLVEEACKKFSFVWVFVISEDISEFSFRQRYEMVCNGLKDLTNVRVLPAGPYLISLSSFPSYFTKDSELVSTHAELDLKLFLQQADSLSITSRFIGEEPTSPSTREYNSCLRTILPRNGIEVVEIPRLCLGKTIVSASEIRSLIQRGAIDEALNFIPANNKELLINCIKQQKENIYESKA